MKKRKRIKLYFKAPQEKLGVIFLAVSVAAFVVGSLLMIAKEKSLLAFGAFMIGCLLIAAFLKFRSVLPSDAQMKIWMEEDLMDLVPRALEECDFDSSEQIRGPEIMISPDFRGVEGVEVLRQKGSDGQIWFSPILVTIVIFTKHQLGVYTCYLDLTSGEPFNESTHVIAYSSISASSIESEDACFSLSELKPLLKVKPEIAELARGGRITITGAHHFTLTVGHVPKFKICLTEPSIRGTRENEEIVRRAREMVRAIRVRLKEVASAAEAKSAT